MNKDSKDSYKSRIAAQLSRTIPTPMNVHREAMTASDLAYRAGIGEVQDTCPVTRGIIREMIEDGALIGSGPKGYRYLTTGKEVQQCLNALLKRTMGINKRIQAIYDAAQAGGIL